MKSWFRQHKRKNLRFTICTSIRQKYKIKIKNTESEANNDINTLESKGQKIEKRTSH